MESQTRGKPSSLQSLDRLLATRTKLVLGLKAWTTVLLSAPQSTKPTPRAALLCAANSLLKAGSAPQVPRMMPFRTGGSVFQPQYSRHWGDMTTHYLQPEDVVLKGKVGMPLRLRNLEMKAEKKMGWA